MTYRLGGCRAHESEHGKSSERDVSEFEGRRPAEAKLVLPGAPCNRWPGRTHGGWLTDWHTDLQEQSCMCGAERERDMRVEVGVNDGGRQEIVRRGGQRRGIQTERWAGCACGWATDVCNALPSMPHRYGAAGQCRRGASEWRGPAREPTGIASTLGLAGGGMPIADARRPPDSTSRRPCSMLCDRRTPCSSRRPPPPPARLPRKRARLGEGRQPQEQMPAAGRRSAAAPYRHFPAVDTPAASWQGSRQAQSWQPSPWMGGRGLPAARDFFFGKNLLQHKIIARHSSAAR